MSQGEMGKKNVREEETNGRGSISVSWSLAPSK